MSNIILSSNENSALLQTLNQSESKVISSIYSTKEIYAPSATSWYTITAKTGTVASSSSESFDLAKYGILQQMIFSYDKKVTFTADGTFTAKIPAGDFFNLVDRVEFLSSSRILCTLYSEDILAQLKDLSTDEYSTVSNFLQGSDTSASGAGAKTVEYKGTIPLVFPFFQNKNTCPNLAFSEPCQLRIVYRDIAGLAKVSNTGANPTDIVSTVTTKLMLRYKMYSEADNAQLLASNYESEMLNMLISKNYKENPVSYTPTAAEADYKFTIEVKNVDVCENFYLLVRGATGLGNGGDQNKLKEIKSVKLSASGQEICSLDQDQLLYMKVSESGWPVNSSYLASSMNDPMSINNVAKIQTGLWTWNKDVWTNGMSLREMNNVIVEVVVDFKDEDANKKFTCYCQELTSCILSQSSNTGRNAISLAN
jgi:hypothetical protein